MVPVRRAASWIAVTRLLLLSVSTLKRLLFLMASVATNTQSLTVAVDKFKMASIFSC